MKQPGLDPVSSRTREDELTRLNDIERKYVDLLAKQKQGVEVGRQENLLILTFDSVKAYAQAKSFNEAVKEIEDIILPKLPSNVKLLIIDSQSTPATYF